MLTNPKDDPQSTQVNIPIPLSDVATVASTSQGVKLKVECLEDFETAAESEKRKNQRGIIKKGFTKIFCLEDGQEKKFGYNKTQSDFYIPMVEIDDFQFKLINLEGEVHLID